MEICKMSENIRQKISEICGREAPLSMLEF